MNRRLQNWLLSLYPRRWRDRYGQEVGNLTDELIDAGETTPLRAGFDLTFSAASERGRALGERWRALGRRRVLAMATAFAMLLVLGFALTGHQVMRSGSSAMTISCRTNFVTVTGAPQRKLEARIARVRVWRQGLGQTKEVAVTLLKGGCGPAGFGCFAPFPGPPPGLRVKAVPKPGGPAQIGQVVPAPGKQWTIDVPARVRQCSMTIHGQAARSKFFRPGPAPAPSKKQVPVKKK